MTTMHLTPSQRRRLQEQLRSTADAGLVRRVLALLEIDRGQSVAQIARRLAMSRQTVYNWMHRFVVHPDPDALLDQYGSGRPKRWTESLQALLVNSLQVRPDQLGYDRVTWTVALLQEHLYQHSGQRLSDDTIRRELDRLGYVWKRYRYVLPPDPKREKKTGDFAAIAAVAAPQRPIGRGRNRFATVSTVARRLGETRPGRTGADHRQQCQTSLVRSD